MRQTKQRKLILEALRENRCHPDADMIYQILKPQCPELSLGTVYRNLNMLSAEGIIQKVTSPSEREHYDSITEPHDHLYCEKCGGLTDLKSEYAPALDEKTAEQNGVRVFRHETIFHGICAKCLEEEHE